MSWNTHISDAWIIFLFWNNVILFQTRTIIGDLESKLSTTKEQLKASNAALEEQVK